MPKPEESAELGSTKRVPQGVRQLIRLESILILVGVIAALKVAQPVVLPLVFGLFLVAIFWPLQHRLQRYLPRRLATAITLLVLLITLGSVGGILWVSGLSIAERLPAYRQELDRSARMVESYGIAIPGFGSDVEASNEGHAIAIDPETVLAIALPVVGIGGLMMLIFSYLVLSLLEFDDYARRVRRILSPNGGSRWLEIAQQVSQDFQRYIVVRTLIGLTSGVAVGIATWLVGLEFAFIWGLLSFLLSYIPIFGSMLALVLPLLFVLVQFDQWHKELLIVVLLVGIRAILSIFVNPMLQGKFLKPTALTVLLSVTFWGWLWGVAGAFIGVPLTILLVIICYQFQNTLWIANLLADMEQT